MDETDRGVEDEGGKERGGSTVELEHTMPCCVSMGEMSASIASTPSSSEISSTSEICFSVAAGGGVGADAEGMAGEVLGGDTVDGVAAGAEASAAADETGVDVSIGVAAAVDDVTTSVL